MKELMKSRCVLVTAILFAVANVGLAFEICPHFNNAKSSGTIQNSNILENSGIAASHVHDDLFYGHNDSDPNNPRIFAFNAAGENLGQLTLGGEGQPKDWEDICTGPGPVSGKNYIYVGQIGDNHKTKGTYAVIRAEEPSTKPSGGSSTIASSKVATYDFRYDSNSKSYNAECLMMDPSTKDFYIVTKSPGFKVFRFPYPQSTSGTTTLEYIGQIPEFVTEDEATDYVMENKVTGGDMTATEMVLRSTKRAWHWEKGSQTWAQMFQTRGKAIGAEIGKSQREAICFDSDGVDLYSLSEGENKPIEWNERIGGGGVDLPPSFTSTPVTSVTESNVYSYVAQATDVDGDTITLSAPTKPSWLTFTAGSGLLTGTPNHGHIGSHSVTLRATDNDGSTDQSFTVTVFAIPVPGAALQHLNATVSASVTGSPVTQWADQTSNGNHAGAGTGSVLYPSSSTSASGLAGLDLGSSDHSLELFSAAASEDWLDFSGTASGNSGFSVLVAFKCDALNTGSWNDLIGNSTLLASGFGMRYSTSGAPQVYLGGVSINPSGSTVQAGDTRVFALNYDAAAGSYTFWDSKNASETSATVAAGDFSTGASVTLGRTSSASRYIDGMVGEVKVFDTVLSSQNFQTERDALVAKWIDGIVNAPPAWDDDPISKDSGQVGVPYSGSLSGDASDPEGDSLTFEKTGGVSWLNVASNGTLSGMPELTGLNWATVTVSDGINPAVSVTVNIIVGEAPVDGYEAWAAANSVDPGDLNNFREYVLDGDATVYGDSDPVIVKNGSVLEYHYKQRNDDAGLRYIIQICSDLSVGDWTAVEITAEPGAVNGAYTDVKHVVPTAGLQTYIRLRVMSQ